MILHVLILFIVDNLIFNSFCKLLKNSNDNLTALKKGVLFLLNSYYYWGIRKDDVT